MNRTNLVIILAALIGGAALMDVARSEPKKGSILAVRALNAQLMRSPQFFGPSVMNLKRGVQVKVIRAQGQWYLVQAGGGQGWIHKNRVSSEDIKLESGRTGEGTTRGEAELAGRGFNPTVEQRFRDDNAELDFSHIDTIEKAGVNPESVAEFMSEGGIRMRDGGGK